MQAVSSSRPSARTSVIARSSGGKTDLKKQGLNKVTNKTVKNNLMGVSEKMKDKNWVDSSGRKGARACAARHARRATSTAGARGLVPRVPLAMWARRE